MSEHALSELVAFQSHEFIQLVQHISEVHEQVKGLQQHFLKFDELLEAQLRSKLESQHMNETLSTMTNHLEALEGRLKTVESHLFQREAEDKSRAVFWTYVRQALPILGAVCGTMLLVGLTLNDLDLVKLLIGQTS